MSEMREESMARNVKWPLSLDDKLGVLRKLQGSIYFEKTLTASSSSLHGDSRLALPFWFVEKHGDKFRKSVILRSESSTKSWDVKLTISSNSPTCSQVKFSGGWKAFATFNGLLEGDSLIFSLTAVSEFEVYVFRGSGSSQGFPSHQVPRKWPNDSGLSRKKTKQSSERRDEQLAAQGRSTEAGTVKLNGLNIAKKREVGEERAVSASGHSPSSSCSISFYINDLLLLETKNVIDSASSRGHHDSNNGQEPALNHDERLMASGATVRDGAAHHTGGRKYLTDNESQDLSLPKITRNSQLPGFFKKLTASDICRREKGAKTARMEIPLQFCKTYGSRLHSIVKLQGIRDESQVRTVACLQSHGKQMRHYLTAGWRDFANENNLEVGQELLFTLTANSFFVVGEVLPPS